MCASCLHAAIGIRLLPPRFELSSMTEIKLHGSTIGVPHTGEPPVQMLGFQRTSLQLVDMDYAAAAAAALPPCRL